MKLWLDLETFSECDLKTHGTHRYAEHESTEIIVAQWAIDDGEPVVCDCTEPLPHLMPAPLVRLLEDPTVTVVAHNSHFDRTILRHVWGIDVPVERWLDTMVKAMAHGLPGGLDKVGQIVGLEDDQAKDKRGRELIQLFCKPRPKGHTLRRATRETHPKEWAEFLEYSRQDIVAMRAIDRKLPSWNYAPGHPELALWHLDQHVNDRGFAADLDLANAAIDAVAVEQKRLKAEVHEATDGLVSSASKRDQLLAFILAEYGVDLPDMKADTLRRRLEDPELPEGVKLLLAIRLEATKTSTAKYKALVNATSADGRMRNTLQFAGAQRTTRWAGRIFQPQNMARPDIALVAEHFGVSMKDAEDLLEDYLDQGVAALKGGYADAVFDNVMGLTANAVRGCIVAGPGRKLCVADLANIEGRGLAHLAGESWKTKAFREYDKGTGADLYVLAYARAFGVQPDAVGKAQRQIGKVMELGLGYEGGVAAFLTFAAVYGMDLETLADAVLESAPADMLARATDMLAWFKKQRRSTYGLPERVWVACETLVLLWRDAHPNTTALWKAAGDSVRAAIQNPGQVFPIGEHLKARRDGAWLRIRLPSGRYLCYVHPRVAEDGQISYFGVNQYTRQWGQIKTYGGKLCIAAGTLVLARRGWTRIENITPQDQVWDGVEWVRTEGNILNGASEVIPAFGALMTPDHLVLTTKGWVRASQSEKHQRAACRLPHGVVLPRERRTTVSVESEVRLRRREDDGCDRAAAPGPAWNHRVMRVPAGGYGVPEADHPWDEQAPGLPRVAKHEGPLRAALAQGLGQLRWAGDYGVRALGRVVRQLLGRHGPDVSPRAHAGPQGQRQGLQPGELPLGHARATVQQHPEEQANRRRDRGATGDAAGDQTLDDVLPAGGGGTPREPGRRAGRIASVYDLVNCGPRHRFVIWAGDAPLIVHNCENATQAFARDVLAANMPLIEGCGYEIVLSVHDELLTETPDNDDFTSDALSQMMSHCPPWAKGLPLAAAGFECYRYRKG